MDNADSPLPRKESNGNTRAGAPVVRRVDTDPHQAKAWQEESSVRHVQTNGNTASTVPSSALTFPSSAETPNTSPQAHFDFTNPNSPLHQRAGSSDSTRSYGNGTPGRNLQRHSGWGKQGQPGPLGVAGGG